MFRVADDAVGSSEDEHSYGEVEESEIQESNLYPADKELKEMLMKKYSGYLSSLRKEFLKRRKKGKLPKDGRLALLNWWNTHYRWPYPTVKFRLINPTFNVIIYTTYLVFILQHVFSIVRL